jgi:hypothetical protein
VGRSSLLLATALDYASDGWHVLPLHALDSEGLCSCREADCGSPAKHPRTKTGLSEATTDPETIGAWWRHWPEANVGVRTGFISGIVVLDVDSYHGGDDGLGELVAEYGELPATMEAETGGGGRHLIFAHPGEGVDVRNRAGLATGVDLRGDGGYIVAPPSLHVSGAFYQWAETVLPAPLPAWLIERPKPPRRVTSMPVVHNPSEHPWVRAAFDGELRDLRLAAEGTRNDQLNRTAFNLGQLVPHALNRYEVESVLQSEAAGIGLTDRETLATIRSGIEAGMEQPRGIPEPKVRDRLPTTLAEVIQLPVGDELRCTPRQAREEYEEYQRLPKIPIIDGYLDLSMRPKQLMVLLARTGHGKTTWIVNTMHRMALAEPDLRFLFVSLEQTRGEWFDRAYRLCSFSDRELSMDRVVEFWTPRLRLVDSNRLGEAALVEMIEQTTEELGARPVVFLDYLGYWAQSFPGDAYHRTSDAVMSLKAIAKHCEVAIVTPHQVSRETGSAGRPSADRARDSGKVNETADFLLTLWYPDMELTPTIDGADERTGQVHIYIDKSRTGGVGRTITYQMAPLSLALVPPGDPFLAQAVFEMALVKDEDAMKFGARSTWQDAIERHAESYAMAHPRPMEDF